MNENQVFDLIVIGTGTAASTTAHECSSVGWKVAIIDSLAFGGTCALRGCDPKKVLVEGVKIIDSAQRHQSKGILGTDKVHVKWSDLIRFKRTFTEPFPKNREEGYKKNGIVPFHGHARFVGRNAVSVEEEGGEEKDNKNSSNNKNNIVLKGKKTLVATGAKPMELNIPGSMNIITSDQFLGFGEDHLPNRIVFVGGGYISFEFAHIAARAGAKVTILHRGKQPLEHFDSDIVNLLVQRSRDIGIDIHLHSTVEKIDKSSDGSLYTVQYSHNNNDNNNNNGEENKTARIQCDMIVHGAGRIPNVEGLDLAAAGIEYTMRGIKVNEYLQSVSNASLYAAGDVADSGGLPLTPVASYEGSLVATNLIQGNVLRSNYSGVPSVVFTIPALASVGMHEKEAKESGFRFRVKHENTASWASSRRVGETCSGFKVLVEEGSNRILGAHLVGPHAEEIINIFSMAIRLGLTAKDLQDPLLYSYPTNASDVIYML
ncbi:MAG: NAD(P)/FAD-dependent oxidoreductase [Thermoproteota archaeon]|nr:NAD(P)/FAD-dependent oxidoreductase [Thermoproteota archaeon]